MSFETKKANLLALIEQEKTNQANLLKQMPAIINLQGSTSESMTEEIEAQNRELKLYQEKQKTAAKS